MAYKTHQKESIELRFDEGYRVECNCGEWKPGTIVKAWYREDSWEEDSWAAYQVQLDDGNLIFAPIDDDNVIRKAAAGSVSPYNPTERTEPMTWSVRIAATWLPPSPFFRCEAAPLSPAESSD